MNSETPFTILTPVARPWLLPSVAASFNSLRTVSWIRLRWVCDFINPREPRDYQNFMARLDRLIDDLPGGYWTFCSDDSILCPELIEEWSKSLVQDPDAGIYLFHQQLADGSIRQATPEILEGGGSLDNGQAIISVDCFKRLGCSYHSLGWERFMFARIAQECGVVFIDKILARHDALRALS